MYHSEFVYDWVEEGMMMKILQTSCTPLLRTYQLLPTKVYRQRMLMQAKIDLFLINK